MRSRGGRKRKEHFVSVSFLGRADDEKESGLPSQPVFKGEKLPWMQKGFFECFPLWLSLGERKKGLSSPERKALSQHCFFIISCTVSFSPSAGRRRPGTEAPRGRAEMHRRFRGDGWPRKLRPRRTRSRRRFDPAPRSAAARPHRLRKWRRWNRSPCWRRARSSRFRPDCAAAIDRRRAAVRQ